MKSAILVLMLVGGTLVSAVVAAAPARGATINLDWGIGVGDQGTTWISAGDHVIWTWTDSLPHSVFSIDGGFTSSSVASGAGTMYDVTFNAPGLYPYDCSIHSSMRGVIGVAAGGDLDRDGDVDGEDFLRWQRGEASNPPGAADLDAWESNYGVGAATAAATNVSEPANAALIVLVL